MAKPSVKQVHFPLSPSDLARLQNAAARGFRPVSQQARLAVLAWLDGHDAECKALSALHSGESSRRKAAR